MNRKKYLSFTAGIMVLTFITFLVSITETSYADNDLVPFVKNITSNSKYPPSDIAWTGSKFLITTVTNGELNSISTQGKLYPFATNCFKIEGTESHIAIARSENYKFGVGNVYVSNGPIIWRINPTGSKCTIFANLTSNLAPRLSSGLTHTQITFDIQGSFGNNMLVTTFDGSVWNVDPNGNFRLLTSNVGTTFGRTISECLDVAPSNFGPISGKLIVGSQSAQRLYAIANDGNITTIKFTLPGFDEEMPTLDNEQCHFLNHNINISNPIGGIYISFFSQGPEGNNSSILKASSDAFVPYAESLIVSDESGTISSIVYNATSKKYVIQGYPLDNFAISNLGTNSKWEGFVFVNNMTEISN